MSTQSMRGKLPLKSFFYPKYQCRSYQLFPRHYFDFCVESWFNPRDLCSCLWWLVKVSLWVMTSAPYSAWFTRFDSVLRGLYSPSWWAWDSLPSANESTDVNDQKDSGFSFRMTAAHLETSNSSFLRVKVAGICGPCCLLHVCARQTTFLNLPEF